MQVISIVTGPLLENAYLFFDEKSKEAVVIDPGSDAEKIMMQIDRLGLTVTHILLTHGHADHIGAVESLRNKYHAKVAIHAGDAEMIASPSQNLSMYLGEPFSVAPAEILLSDGAVIQAASAQIEVLHTPGHSSGSICFLTDEFLFSGDTLFEGSIGRTDFEGGDVNAMRTSLGKLKEISGDRIVYPGHGGATTLEQEKAMNPYMGW